MVDIFRIAKPADANQIYEITQHAGNGLTTIPKTKAEVNGYINETSLFLNGHASANRILFVIERDGVIHGISGIIPILGHDRPFYSFKRSSHTRRSKAPALSVTHDTLQLSTEFDGYTELASIFLSPEARGKGLGRLLSLGRLGFIHRHRALFSDRIMADIRGWAQNDGESPFWNGLTSKFIKTTFEEADQMSCVDGDFIDVLIPSIPIMLNVLPQEVSDCSGRPHERSKGALRLLTEVGFNHTDLCDVFDGGPSIRARFDNTLIGKTARKKSNESSQITKTPCLHFGGSLNDFMATLGPDDDSVIAELFTRKNLNVPSLTETDHWVAAAYPTPSTSDLNTTPKLDKSTCQN